MLILLAGLVIDYAIETIIFSLQTPVKKLNIRVKIKAHWRMLDFQKPFLPTIQHFQYNLKDLLKNSSD